MRTQHERLEKVGFTWKEATEAKKAAADERRKTVAVSENTAIINGENSKRDDNTVQTIGKIDPQKYRVVSEAIRTDEVVITDERIQHIKDHHPNDFERYSQYISKMLESPQYILEDSVPNTAVILQHFVENDEHFRLILKLAVVGDAPAKKNSVITFLKISEKKFKKYLRNKKILYTAE